MIKSDKNYKYLLRLYSTVNEYLSEKMPDISNLSDIIVAFCIVIEKLLKIKLAESNPLLPYDTSKIKDDSAFVAALKSCDKSIDTIPMWQTLVRYQLMFESDLSEEECQTIKNIYESRNHFIHSHKSDDEIMSDHEKIISQMGTVWTKISKLATDIFGSDSIKSSRPKKIYTKEQLEEVLEEEVRKKIDDNKDPYSILNYYRSFSDSCLATSISPWIISQECPRCGYPGFSNDENSLEIINVSIIPRPSSDLYRCKKCNLELTKKEYEIARKLKGLGS